MRIALIGIGQAGGKITDELLKYDIDNNAGFVKGCLAINSARQDLSDLEHVPENESLSQDSRRMLIGNSEVNGSGVGADNEKGRDIMQESASDVISEIQSQILMHEVDAFLLVAGLGGGTGSGGMPVLAKEIKNTIKNKPVYGLGVLPSKEEGKIYTLNAAKSLEASVEHTDNLMIFDNDEWSRGSVNLGEWYSDLNSKIVERFGTLFASGEIENNDDVGESVVDASEIINTLNCGGVSTIGHASAKLDDEQINPGFMKMAMGGPDIDTEAATSRMRSITSQAINGQLTLNAEIESTERALTVFAGPEEFMTRKGMQKGRTDVEDQTDCMEVRGGDYPVDKDEVSATVLLSGLYDIPRIKELQKIALEARNEIEDKREEREEKFDELMNEGEGKEIDGLLE